MGAGCAIAVGLGGIEIDAVAGVEMVILLVEMNHQSAIEDMNKLHTLVLVRMGFLVLPNGELRQVRFEDLSGSREGKALEEIRRVRYVGPLGKTHPLFVAHDREEPLSPARSEEVVKSHVEDHRDAREGGQGGYQFSRLELGQHGGRETGMFSQVGKRDLFPQSEFAKLPSEIVRSHHAGDRFLARFLHFKTRVSNAENWIAQFSLPEMRFSVSETAGRTSTSIQVMARERSMHIYSGALRDLSENDLIQLARQGSPEAFSELMRRSRPRLLRAAEAIVNSAEEAEDAFQNASWKAYEHLANFRQESSFNTWLTTIVVNQARMRMREVRRVRLVSLDETAEDRPAPVPELADLSEDPERAFAGEELRRILHQEIRRLPAPLRQIMLLYVENHSAADVAKRLGLSVAAAKTRLFRARQHLYSRMQRYAELPELSSEA